MFKIEKNKLGVIELVTLKNTQNDEFLTVVPERGGLLYQIGLRKKDELYSLLDTCGSEADLLENQWYKGTKLLPFANRVKDGKYSFNGTTYQLPINMPQEGHAIHGFLYNQPWSILSKNTTGDKAELTLSYSYDGNHAGFPFPFEAKVVYSLDEKSEVKTRTIVKNTGEAPMPMSDGWHAYFQLSESANTLQLSLPVCQRIEVDDRRIPTGNFIAQNEFIEPQQIDDTFFDTGYKIAPADGHVVTRVIDPNQNLQLNIWQETGEGKYNFLQVFVPPGRKSVAVEPMTSKADTFNNDDGLIVLAPGDTFDATCGVNLK